MRTLLFILMLIVPAWLFAQLPFLIGGIQVNEPDHAGWVSALQEVGMNAVSVTVYARQGDWDSDQLVWEAEDKAVLSEIRAAKAGGLRVVLILRLQLDHAYERNRFLWHGMVMPAGDAQLASWFEKYGRFARKWALIAEEEGVDVFGIGSEMNALSSTREGSGAFSQQELRDYLYYQKHLARRTAAFEAEIQAKHLRAAGSEAFPDLRTFLHARLQAQRQWARQVYFKGKPLHKQRIADRARQLQGHWKALIAGLREVYKGFLTYAANFDNVESVGFWQELDLIGINAYYPLRKEMIGDDSEMDMEKDFRKSWGRVFAGIGEFQKKEGLEDKPVLLTELGYTYRQNCTVQPWAHDEFTLIPQNGSDRLVIWKEQAIDYEERAMAVASLCEVAQEAMPGNFGGMLFWKLSTLRQHKDIEPYVIWIGKESDDPILQVLPKP